MHSINLCKLQYVQFTVGACRHYTNLQKQQQPIRVPINTHLRDVWLSSSVKGFSWFIGPKVQVMWWLHHWTIHRKPNLSLFHLYFSHLAIFFEAGYDGFKVHILTFNHQTYSNPAPCVMAGWRPSLSPSHRYADGNEICCRGIVIDSSEWKAASNWYAR